MSLILIMLILPYSPPGGEWHDAVVNNVEGGEVSPLLSEDKEERVEVVDELGEEIPPGHVRREQPFLGVGVVDGLAQPVVPASQPEVAGLLENPQAEKGLEQIVGNHQLLDIVGWSVLHESWPSVSDDVVVDSTEAKHRPRGRHEEPVIHPGKENCD